MYHIGPCHLCFQILHGPAVIPQRKPTGPFLVDIIDADDLNPQFTASQGCVAIPPAPIIIVLNIFPSFLRCLPETGHADQIDSYRENIICGFRLSSSVNGIKSPLSPISGESSTDMYPE